MPAIGSVAALSVDQDLIAAHAPQLSSFRRSNDVPKAAVYWVQKAWCSAWQQFGSNPACAGTLRILEGNKQSPYMLKPTGCRGVYNQLFGPMRYTQGQVRDLLQVPVETLRRWRSGVAALAQHRGHGPTFSPGDVVALAIVSDLVNLYGLRVNSLSDRLDQLFKLCHGCSWLTLETCIILIMPDNIRLTPSANHRLDEADGTILMIPVRPIVARLRAKLIASEVDEPQPRLSFPPTPLTGLPR